MTTAYTDFLAGKRRTAPDAGFEVPVEAISPVLFEFQRDIVRWALKKGRAAVFTTTGSGKTLIQCEWARHVHERTRQPVLILAPLAVARQTVREADEKLGLHINLCRAATDVGPGLNITNYERLHHFVPAMFGAVVLDESGILKNFSGVTKKALISAFQQTPYRLCCTATPAPNDTVELCNHSDFLGVMSQADMISTFFISKGEDQKASRFRLKKHAREAFFRWLASWSMSLTKPSDLGYSDEGFILPQLTIEPVFIPSDWKPADQLMFTGLKGVSARAEVRRGTLETRVAAVAEIVNREPNEQWLLWCGLNDEARLLAALLPDAVNVEGADDPDEKADRLSAFARGETRILVTKPSIAAHGLNLQSCARMVFVGLGDSFEQYFQAIRRSWRFGQIRPVTTYIVLSDLEAPVYENILRKEQEHVETMRELLAAVEGYEREQLAGLRGREDYQPKVKIRLPAWLAGASLPASQSEHVRLHREESRV